MTLSDIRYMRDYIARKRIVQKISTGKQGFARKFVVVY